MASGALILHPKRGTVNSVARPPGSRTLVSTLTPLERFRRYCQFDPTTGCVLWIGGTARGRGKSAPYGVFWYEGARWFAHRWSAQHIHGLDIDGYTVDHCCDEWRAGGSEPLLPNTLCVQHVQPLSRLDNTMLAIQRRTWVLTQKGYYEPPPLFAELQAPPGPHLPPLHERPAWLGVDTSVNTADDDCPF